MDVTNSTTTTTTSAMKTTKTLVPPSLTNTIGKTSSWTGSGQTSSIIECTEEHSCHNFHIIHCTDIHCVGVEACEGTIIQNFTHRVVCDGLHSCHRAEMESFSAIEDDEEEDQDDTGLDTHQETADTSIIGGNVLVSRRRQVICQGTAACDVAEIIDSSNDNRDEFHVQCIGPKACRKATISIAQTGTVTCSMGDSRFEACEGLVTIMAPCLYCHDRGCSSFGNSCRFSNETTTISSTNNRYHACIPDSAMGNCYVPNSPEDHSSHQDDEYSN